MSCLGINWVWVFLKWKWKPRSICNQSQSVLQRNCFAMEEKMEPTSSSDSPVWQSLSTHSSAQSILMHVQQGIQPIASSSDHRTNV